MPMAQSDVLSFVNPHVGWRYEGAFSVTLMPGTDVKNVPQGTKIESDIVHVKNGRIKDSPGIQLFSDEQPFYFAFDSMVEIRSGDGRLLWVNDNYRNTGGLKCLTHDELRASAGLFRPVVMIDSEHYQIGDDTQTREIALHRCAVLGKGQPVQIFDDQGKRHFDENGGLKPQ